jgi:acetyl esterase/lipase
MNRAKTPHNKILAMKFLLLTFTSVLFSCTLHAQELTMPLWKAGQVPYYKKTDEKEIRDSGETIKILKVQSPDITVYMPAKRTATGQAVIICPGGGYTYLSYNWEGSDPARWLNSKGIAAIVLKYRLPNSKSLTTPHAAPLADAKRAMRMVRFYADKWHINRNKIGIMGFSAGGHLASTLATHFDAGDSHATDSIEQLSSRPDFAILVYPVISMMKPNVHGGSRNNLIGENADSSLLKLYSNELRVTKETPTCFLVHATDDKTVPVTNSILFYQALVANGVPAEMHIFPKGGHGFGLGLGKGSVESWTALCIDWLRSLNVAETK